MDQVKIGSFIKTLRKEKALTQEQLAERFSVARRTVSRWETGSNLPDMDILIALSDYFEVDLRELLDGERKPKMMDCEMKETILKVAEYSSDKSKAMARMVLAYFVVGILALIVHEVLSDMAIANDALRDFLNGFTIGLAIGAMLLGILYVTGKMEKMRAFKRRLLGMEE